ncbi:polysaccharide pyruvyl transferase family protein [Herbiconiux sp. 11R-BC]|uniref:polysaccharide pyruvyl transferase family protein n=1 Tax=Herbiconiux sp. 11R-BC TaxID=3111637 RepID=UPI003C0DEC37
MNERSPSVLLIGAYERENFGDLLFLLRTRAYLGDSETTASAPFSGEMLELLGERIPAYSEALAERPHDAVWVVGGEVGGTTVSDAYRMSATDEEWTQYQQSPQKERWARLEQVSGMRVAASPYLPRMSAFPQTYGSALVVNSVGLSGMRRLLGDRRDETLGAVREAAFVSVRDRQSSDLLRQLSITHTLAPDLVHTLTIDEPGIADKQSDLALVQVKGNVLSRYGAAELARVLATSRNLADYRIRLFSAGSARGHDSFELYQDVVDEFRKMAPGRQIDISTQMRPMDKAAEIASAGLWLGTSLHGLIISTAYDVPRVALELDKLVRYAETWEETMPFGVALDDIDAAVDSALAASEASVKSKRSLDLAQQAQSSIREAVSAAASGLSQADLSARRERIARRVDRRRKSPVNALVRAVRPGI